MPLLMTKAKCKGKIEKLLLSPTRSPGLEKKEADRLELRFDGIAGDCHSGLTRDSDSRTLILYKRGTPIRNVRQLTVLSVEDLTEIARAMNIPMVLPEWLGGNMLTSGIPSLTLLPPSTRLQFPSGATIVVDMENKPCRQVADVIAQYHPKTNTGFVRAAEGLRGITAWVEREGEIRLGDDITLFLPPQRIYDFI